MADIDVDALRAAAERWRGRITAAGGYALVPSAVLRDGEILLRKDPTAPATALLFVGTRPLTDVELAGEEARHVVREGMADVLAWLGEDVGPVPVRSGRAEALLQKLTTGWAA